MEFEYLSRQIEKRGKRKKLVILLKILFRQIHIIDTYYRHAYIYMYTMHIIYGEKMNIFLTQKIQF